MNEIEDNMEIALINRDQSKVIEWVYHLFLAANPKTVGFEPEYQWRISLLYGSHTAEMKINGKRLENFDNTLSVNEDCPLSSNS